MPGVRGTRAVGLGDGEVPGRGSGPRRDQACETIGWGAFVRPSAGKRQRVRDRVAAAPE